jgi:hypothetical protein
MHFIVAWSVNVVAATNFHGSDVPQAATTTVIATVLYIIMITFY